MHTAGKSTLALVSKWNSGKVNYIQQEIYSKISKKISKNKNIPIILSFDGFHYQSFVLMSSMAWVKRCYSEKSKNLNKLLVFEALYL